MLVSSPSTLALKDIYSSRKNMNEVKVRNFQSNFWGDKDNGLDALMSRMRDSKLYININI